jgi:hypothetical protein
MGKKNKHRVDKELTASARKAETVLNAVAAQIDSTVLRMSIDAFTETRVAYRFDPDLLDALRATDLKIIPPADAVRHLPHDTFVATFGEPIEVWDEEDELSRRFHGVLVNGLPDIQRDIHGRVPIRIVGASSPEAVTIRGTFYGTLGTTGEAAITTATITLGDDRPLDEYFQWTFENAVDDGRTRYRQTRTTRVEYAVVQPTMQAELAHILWMILLYLASPEPDIIERDTSDPSGRTRKPSTPQVSDVGWRVGAMLRAAAKGSGRSLGGTVRPHVRRGHWHTYLYGADRTDRRLKWVHPTIVKRGEPIDGVIYAEGDTDIDVTITVGADYRPATAVESDVEYEAAPDLRGRGAAVHAELQNLLADHIAATGRAVFSPTPDDPQYDLAWEIGDVIVVVEVKSLGSLTEQMRLGVGQVIEYRYNMAGLHSRPVRAVLFVEHDPGADWVALCDSEGIVVAWPDRMAALHDLLT